MLDEPKADKNCILIRLVFIFIIIFFFSCNVRRTNKWIVRWPDRSSYVNTFYNWPNGWKWIQERLADEQNIFTVCIQSGALINWKHFDCSTGCCLLVNCKKRNDDDEQNEMENKSAAWPDFSSIAINLYWNMYINKWMKKKSHKQHKNIKLSFR